MELFNFYVLMIFVLKARAAEWDYGPGEHGPAHWEKSCQTGKKQSPIKISFDSTTYDHHLGTFSFVNYDVANMYSSVINNGHSIQVDLSDVNVKISGGGLVDSDYILAQFHLHWGATSTVGSEHWINGVQYPMEIHFVHYNGIHQDLTSAVNATNGLAVLGFLFQIQNADNPNLNFLVNSLTHVENGGSSYNLTDKPAVKDIFRNINLNKFVRYNGSLTTPGCYESVQWTLFTDRIPISEIQMNKIRATYSNDGQPKNNFRPTNSLNSRIIYRSYDTGDASFLKQDALFMSILYFTMLLLS